MSPVNVGAKKLQFPVVMPYNPVSLVTKVGRSRQLPVRLSCAVVSVNCLITLWRQLAQANRVHTYDQWKGMYDIRGAKGQSRR